VKKVFLAILITVITGCSTQTYYVNNERAIDPDKEESQTFFISGIGQQQEIDAAKVCGGVDKIAKVESELTFVDGLLGGITFGIYTPRTARIYCSK